MLCVCEDATCERRLISKPLRATSLNIDVQSLSSDCESECLGSVL